jgi:hypothetical protein
VKRMIAYVPPCPFPDIARCPQRPSPDHTGLPSGDQSAVEPPGPFPNPEVKRRSADGIGTIGPVRVGRCQVYARLQAIGAGLFFLSRVETVLQKVFSQNRIFCRPVRARLFLIVPFAKSPFVKPVFVLNRSGYPALLMHRPHPSAPS